MKKALPLIFILCCIFCYGQNNSLQFDGVDDYVELSNPLSIGTISHTVEMWVKIPLVGTGGLASGERVGVLIGNYNSNPNCNYEIHANGQIRVWWNNGQISSFSSADLRDNSWHHIACVRDKTLNAFRVYIDGILDFTVNTSGSDIVLNTPPRIGGDRRNSTGGPSFHGHIDDLRIWDHARTVSQIQSSMNIEMSGLESGLLANFKMDVDDSSCDIEDCSLIENHGTRVGAGGANNSPQFSSDIPILTNVDCGSPIACTAFPVELLHFAGKLEKKAIQLNWTTASELNNAGFEIEKSEDASTWQAIDFVKGQTISTEINDYQYWDENPNPGINYYRLKQIDFNGDFDFSAMISLNWIQNQKIKVFPNPTNGIIELTTTETGRVNIYNSLGQLIIDHDLSQTNKVDLSAFPNAIYFISVYTKDQILTSPIVKR